LGVELCFGWESRPLSAKGNLRVGLKFGWSCSLSATGNLGFGQSFSWEFHGLLATGKLNCLLTERSVKGINASYRKCLLIMDLLCILHNILFRKTSFKLSQSWQFIKATGNASSSAGLTFIPFYISIIFTVHIVYHYQLLTGRNW